MTKEYVMKRLKLLTEHKGVQTFNYDEASIVLEEIERLKEVEKEHQKLNGELREEIERLNNIINEIEHHLYQEWLEWKDSDCESIYSRAGEDKAIYDYLQELKGDDKE